MADQYARVTVVGLRRRVDVSVPAHAPIVQYVGVVARLVGEPTDELLPAAWSLAADGFAPFPPTSSLRACGVLDGQVLRLRDVLEGEADAPVVFDIEEAVEDASRRYDSWAWTARSRAALLLLAAPAWLIATAGAALVAAPTGHPAPYRPLAGVAMATAVASAGAAAALRSRPVPTAVRHLLALAVIPSLALTGGFLTAGHGAMPAVGLGASIGALAGSLIALAALPGTAMLALPGLALIAVLATAALSVAHAHASASAGTAVVLALVLARITPRAVGRLVAHSPFERGIDLGDPRQVAAQVHRGWLAVAWLEATLAVVQAVALVWLAGTRQPFALILAGCAAFSLVAGAGAHRQLTEVVPDAVAGAIGLLALSAGVTAWFHAPVWIAPTVQGAVGLCLLLIAIGAAMRAEAGVAARRPRFLTPAAVLLRIAVVPAVAGVYGLFDQLTALGRQL